MFAENSLVVGVDFHQSAGDTEAESLSLAFVATAVEVYVDVVFLGAVKCVEGLFYDVLKNRRGEVYLEGALVDGNDAGAFFDDNAVYGGLLHLLFPLCDYFSLLMSITVGF